MQVWRETQAGACLLPAAPRSPRITNLIRNQTWHLPSLPPHSFLNKLLGMRLEDQKLVFEYFAGALDKVGDRGEEGRLGRGQRR